MMREELRQIYLDLRNNTLSKAAALARIRQLKLRQDQQEAALVYAVPDWETRPALPSGQEQYDERRLLLCGFESVDAGAFPHCAPVRAPREAGPAERYAHHALDCFAQLQAIHRSAPKGKLLVQLAVADGEHGQLDLGLTGLMRTAAEENPHLATQVVMLPADASPAQLLHWLDEEARAVLDPVVSYEGGQRRVLCWGRASAPPATAVAFKDDGVYLITGGLGGLGRLFAREILGAASRARVVLTGRHALDQERRELVQALDGGQGRVDYRALDLGDAAQVRQLVAALGQEHGQLKGILHAAGMTADMHLPYKTAEDFTRVLAPKVAGTVNLDAASAQTDLDFFALFSSVAGAFGNSGQADYAAANGFMDQFAHYRQRMAARGERRGKTLSINWPLWQDGGMRIDAASQEILARATGMTPLRTPSGMRAFGDALAAPACRMLVMEGVPERIELVLACQSLAPRQEPQGRAAPSASSAADAAGAVLLPADLAQPTLDFLREELSKVLKLPAQKIEPAAPWERYGFDSILAVSLINQLEQSFGPLSKTLFFEYHSTEELAGYFIESHAARLRALFAPAAPAPTAAPASRTRPGLRRAPASAPRKAAQAGQEQDAIAIIGLSGRYPQADDLEAYWRNLRDGRDCITEVPKSRWDWQQYYSEDRREEGRHFSKWGGFISGVDEFDPQFFNISPREAKTMDPQERLFLQHAWMAVEDAGYTRASLQAAGTDDLPGQVGVYAGLMYSEYQLFAAEAGARGARVGVPGSFASIANRVSYVLNLHGPSMTVDTMCSSSLTAIHLACQDLRLGRTQMAIAGGVNVSIHPAKYLMLSAGQFISGDGHCQSFGEGGDGYIPGEGVGVVILKPLAAAQRDGDQIYGVVKGSALNHGGKTNGYTVPNPQAQAGVVSRALADAGIDARQVSYIEAHGTGTRLGDPIEIAALAKAFRKHTADVGFCLIGSAKSNIGHCESAAGIAGLSKVLLQMRHRQIVPSLHSARLNPHIDFAATPFVVNQELRQWEAPVVDGRSLPRIAGLSSFGAGGSNAHLLIEEYVAAQPAREFAGPVAVVLSARTPAQLMQKADALLAFVAAHRDAGTLPGLAAIAYTLQVGREAMEERAGFMAASSDELCERLRELRDGQPGAGTVLRGRASAKAEQALSAAQAAAGKDPAILLAAWVDGHAVDWNHLYGEDRPVRTSLPTYPFARTRYWIDEILAAQAAPAGTAKLQALHPLLHLNTSDLEEQRYSSVFSGAEPFFTEQGAKQVLMPAAYLEMTRAAIEHAQAGTPEAGMLELRELAWGSPFLAASGTLHVALARADDGETVCEAYGADETILFQANARHVAGPAPERIDMAGLDAAGQSGALFELDALDAGLASAGGQVLDPRLLERAMRASASLLGLPPEAALPAAAASVTLVAPCTGKLLAWARRTGDGELDIDLCDPAGQVHARVRGLRFQRPAMLAAPRALPALPPAPLSSPLPAPLPASRTRAGAVALADPQALAAAEPQAARQQHARIALSKVDKVDDGAAGRAAAAPEVRLHDHGDGILALHVEAAQDNLLTGELCEQLLQALEHAGRQASLKVLLVKGRASCFLRGGRPELDAALERGLYRSIAEFPCPTIAVAEGAAHGAGFLFAALCDFLVCATQAQYSFTEPAPGLVPTAAEDLLLRERFGSSQAESMLCHALAQTGAQLKQRGWTPSFVEAAGVAAHAHSLAKNLSAKPQAALRLLKEHLGRHIAARARELAVVPQPPAGGQRDGKTSRMPESTPHLRVAGHAGGALVVTFRKKERAKARVLLAEMAKVLAAAGAAGAGIVIGSEYDGFLPPALCADDALAALVELLMKAPLPVVAALPGDTAGPAWLLAQFCDACVYAQEGRYAFDRIGSDWQDGRLASAAASIFRQRFGHVRASEILLSGRSFSAQELQLSAPAVMLAPAAQVLPAALDAVRALAAIPAATRAGWKAQFTRRLVAAPETGPAADAQDTGLPAQAPFDLDIGSDAVRATQHPDGVLEIRMEERAAKNMFSEELASGLHAAFAHASVSAACKAVLLTGYEGYFASGGTKDNLIAIHEGKVRFTDNKVYELALRCPVPVVAAMQGHAIGAGWCLGMFADFPLFGQECQYVSPYMNYGFTPGAGASFIFPEKIGHDLARETLLTGQPVSGSALRDRGMPAPVLPKEELLDAARALARDLARSPRARLLRFKQLLVHALSAPLEDAYARELALHEQTFVGQSITRTQIEQSFPDAAAVAVRTTQPPPPAQADGGLGESEAAITAVLRQLLARELHLAEEEVADHTEFIDLGMDSITGVTWIRRINETYGLALEATRIYSYPTLARLSRLVHAELAARRPASPAPAAQPQSAAQALDSLAAVTATLRKLLADELHLEQDEVGDGVEFIQLGMDSITGVTWVRRIGERYGLTLEASKIYSHPTLAAFSRLVHAELAERQPAAPSAPLAQQAPAPAQLPPPDAPAALLSRRRQGRRPAASSAAAADRSTMPVAVIGMAGQFPQARNVDEFWRNIADGRNCISEVAPRRWSVDAWYQPGDPAPGKTNSRWLGALEDYDAFDPLFFGISPAEAQSMDPQQRLFLEACWHAIEYAGYNPRALSGSRCGVFAGCASGDYQLLSPEVRMSAQGFTGAASSILAARIAYFLDLQGPCISIDTACSSSLVAIANACDSLNAGTSDLALAGGVYVMAGPEMHIKTAQAGMLSTDGRCHSFDQRANGFVPGEAVGVAVLKRLEDAVRDRDPILAVIEGWGVNQDGKTNGITAPNPESQTRLECEVYQRFGIDPSQIQLVEAHGTGTRLGDPIEIEALKESFGRYTRDRDYCALGSAKSNIGHCLTAAGIAGFIKLLLALKHEQLPPTINFEQLNEHIKLADSPFYVNRALRDWRPGSTGRRRAAVSSFGFSGTNAHVVLGQYQVQASASAAAQVAAVRQGGRVAIPLSARTPEQLVMAAQALLEFVRRAQPAPDLLELAYTLQVGRAAMDERLVVLAASIDELAQALQAFVGGGSAAAELYQGQVRRHREAMTVIAQDPEARDAMVDTWVARKQLSKLAAMWVKGLELDWNRLYGEARPARIALPTYPFARERYWIEAAAGSQAADGAAWLHPLLHRNTSDLFQQRYSSTFSGAEFFLERQAQGAVLPALACLEMVRAALADALPGPHAPHAWDLRDLEWRQAVPVTSAKELSVVLCEGHGEEVEFALVEGSGDDEIVYCEGYARAVRPADLQRIDLDGLKGRMGPAPLDDAAERGGIAAVFQGQDGMLAQLRLPEPAGAWMLHPALAAAALHLAARITNGERWQPRALEQVEMLGRPAQTALVWVRTGAAGKLDVDVCDESGQVCLRMRGLVLEAQGAGPALEAAQELLFREVWREAPRAAAASGGAGLTLLFVDAELEQALARDPDACAHLNPVFVRIGQARGRQADGSHACPVDNPEAIQALIAQVSGEHGGPIDIAYDWARGRREEGVLALFGLFRAIKAAGPAVAGVTLIGRYAPAIADTCWDYAWIGFERSLRLVMPDLRISLLYTDAPACTARQLRDAVHARGVTWYQGQRAHALAVEALAGGIDAADAPPLKQGGAYLITGGCGALGFKFAQHLAQHCQAALLLVGRRALDADIQAQLDLLAAAGARQVHYHPLDIGQPEALAAWTRQLGLPISGVFHAAGNESSGTFDARSEADIRQVLQPKTLGTQALDAALGADHPLDFVCYFASSAALLGDLGSCDYAIANRFQMAYGEHRRRLGASPGETVVINWPLWEKDEGQQGGMGQADPALAAFYLKSSGQQALSRAAGIRIWQGLSQCERTQTLVMVGQAARVRQALERACHGAQPDVAPVPAPLREPVRAPVQAPAVPAIAAAAAQPPREQVVGQLRKMVCAALRIGQDKLENGVNLADYGFDSIGLAAFARQLSAHYGVAVTPALFFTHASIQQLADWFLSEHGARLAALHAPARVAPVAEQPVAAARALDVAVRQAGRPRGRVRSRGTAMETIAIVGMSGRFPQARDVDGLWAMLAGERSGIGEVPRSRWNWHDYFVAPGHPHNRISTNRGGFVDGIDEFDPLFFEVPPREAVEMDPAERILLMEAYHAIEDARMSPATLRGGNVGVFVGMEESHYGGDPGLQGVTTAGAAMISSRLSYFLDLHGPAIVTNTACSSSLVALHQAAASLRQGECDAALVAGVALNLAPQAWEKMSAAGMISPSGQCHSFGRQADGIGIGEAVVVLVLKPLSAAEAAGDHVYGTIRASGVNFDGKTNGVTAPNGQMQARLIEDIYSRAGIGPGDVSHIVAHGTGTKLGDPVEVNALDDAFRKLGARQGLDLGLLAPCALTSTKGNVGHTLAASGLVSVVGLLKGLEHGKIPGSLHCEQQNDYINWQDSHFRVNTSTCEWRAAAGRPRMGGVSAFGRSGTNAHVVIEEYRPARAAARAGAEGPVLVPLSANTPEQLDQRVSDLAAFLRGRDDIDLADLAYSLQVTREAMPQRLALVVDSAGQLAGRLDAWLAGERQLDDLWTGGAEQARQGIGLIGDDEDMREAIGKWLAGRKLAKLAQLWVQGIDLDWEMLHGAGTARRIALPVYPFARERYWHDAGAEERRPGPRPDLRHEEHAAGPESIEAIINGIADGSLETGHAVARLKRVV